MARLIDADLAIAKIKDDGILGSGYSEDERIDDVCDMIDSCPTVDAVEVVRCKDCKHSVWDEENEMWKCVESAEYDEKVGEWFGFYEYHNGDFFCSYGERKAE